MGNALKWTLAVVLTYLSLTLVGWGIVWLSEEPFELNIVYSSTCGFLREMLPYGGSRVEYFTGVVVISMTAFVLFLIVAVFKFGLLERRVDE